MPALCVPLCRNRPNTGAAMWFPCTSVFHPQRPDGSPNIVNRVIHSPTTPLAATRPSYPQNAQPLILLLRSIPSFFFEVQAWGRSSRGPHGVVADPFCRPLRLPFKMAAEDLRLFIELLATGGWRLDFRTNTSWVKGRYGRGDDNSWPHRLEVSSGARILRRRGVVGGEESADGPRCRCFPGFCYPARMTA